MKGMRLFDEAYYAETFVEREGGAVGGVHGDDLP